MEIKTVGVVGLGALGLMYGEHIQNAIGRENICFAMDKERYERHSKDTYTVNGKEIDFNLIDCTDAKPTDLLIVAVKYNSLDSALDTMKKLIGEHTIIISLMNGTTSEEIISARYPHKTVIPCVAIGMDAMRSGTELSYVNKGLLQVGITDEKMRPSLKALDAFLTKTGIPHTVESDIMHAMWNKFMINVGINQACMIYDSPYDGIMSSPEKRASLTRAMREVIALSKAEGTNITEDDFNAAMELFNKLDKNSYPSMHQDFKAKRKSEVELFAGTVRNLAAKHGIPVHENDFYYKRITEIESAY